jgi:hypothetical protein
METRKGVKSRSMKYWEQRCGTEVYIGFSCGDQFDEQCDKNGEYNL